MENQLAQVPRDNRTFAQIIGEVLSFIDLIIPIVISLAFLAFLIGLFKFISGAGDAKNHADGKKLMIWGTIALFIMISVWGILRFLSSEFGFGPLGLPLLPGGLPGNF